MTVFGLWQRHVLECQVCGSARSADEICQVGKNFWGTPGSAMAGVVGGLNGSGVGPGVVVASPSPQIHHQQTVHVEVMAGQQPSPSSRSVETPAPAWDLQQFTARAAERVVARTSSGAAISVPMEKTSRAIEIASAPGVILRMPERDIEVYSAMKTVIGRLLRMAEMLGTYLVSLEELKRMGRELNVPVGEAEVALVVRKVSQGRGFGALAPEQLFDEFTAVMQMVVGLGDGMGRFMTVDGETRAVMKEVRSLGVDMKGEVERSPGGRLVLDEDTRRITRNLRMVAVSLQGEIERRLGT